MTSRGLMRTLLPSRLLPASPHRVAPVLSKLGGAGPSLLPSPANCDSSACLSHCRCFAQVQDLDKLNRDVWFTSSRPRYQGINDDKPPPDERTLQLGKTVRTLHDRLPTLLQSPLPGDILSPQISLHLFPSTHPHLPTVSGKIAYIAALWTAPVAWGRVPLVGNVKLSILSERMIRNGGSAVPLESRDEKLVVKWKTCGKTRHRDGTGGIYRGAGLAMKDPVDRIRDFIIGTAGRKPPSYAYTPDEFCGLFIFEFDDQGRILKHTIEHAEQGGNWDKATRVVSVTDWLLGRINGKRKDDVPALAWCEERNPDGRAHIVDRTMRRLD